MSKKEDRSEPSIIQAKTKQTNFLLENSWASSIKKQIKGIKKHEIKS